MASSDVTTRTTCRLCGSRDLFEVLSFGETPLANAYLSADQQNEKEIFAPLTVDQCISCKLVQLREVVDPTVLFSRYLYVSGTSKVFRDHFARYASDVVDRFKLNDRSLVVDIGSNDGVLLSYVKEKGVRILGVDPAKNIAAEATRNGIPTIGEFFSNDTADRIVAKEGKASVITANNVFAHTDTVVDFVEAVKTLLAPEGAFIFEVQYLKDLIEKNLFDIVYHEHLLYYHLAPLIPFFERRGMRVFDVEHVDTHGGSIRVFVGWSGGPHVIANRVSAMRTQEGFLNSPETYRGFAARIIEGKEKLRALMNQWRAEGKRVVGYGAPAKATTLCYAYGIDGSMLEYIVDDAILKQGLFMPGTHIPIKAPDVLYADKPDVCLILAWNFADSIVQSHHRFVEQGGTFVSPVPEPHVVS